MRKTKLHKLFIKLLFWPDQKVCHPQDVCDDFLDHLEKKDSATYGHQVHFMGGCDRCNR